MEGCRRGIVVASREEGEEEIWSSFKGGEVEEEEVGKD